jgi:hypothetical protein
MKYIITESKLRRVQFKYLDYLFEGMHEIKMLSPNGIFSGPNTIFWKKDDSILLALRIREKNKLEVTYPIWEDISNMFSLDYYETQELMEEWAEKRLGVGKVKSAAVDFF